MTITRYYSLTICGTKQEMKIDSFITSNVPEQPSPKIRVNSQVEDGRCNMRIKVPNTSSYFSGFNPPVSIMAAASSVVTLPTGVHTISSQPPPGLSVSVRATMYYRIDLNGTLEECLQLLNEFGFSEVVGQITEQVIS